VRAVAPASSANLGPGFDAIAVALDAYVEVTVRPAARLEVVQSGEGSHLPGDHSHLAAKVAIASAGHDRLRVEVSSAIPLGRGLGSSAALAVAAAAAAGHPDPFAVGAQVDGHPENAAASAFGGLVVAATVEGRHLWRRLRLDPGLGFVALIPERTLLTEQARAVLPSSVSLADAAFNLGRLGLLLAGLADREQLLAEAGDDRLHQPARTSLFPEAPALLAGLRRLGALTSFWSGAGSTLMAVCRAEEAPRLAEAAGGLLLEQGVVGSARVLRPDLRGVVVEAQ
jgi:homoserine kinase